MDIRLAFREEGTFWNVYLAHQGTMENAKHIGSIAIGAVRKNPDIKRDFMELMKQVLADAVKETTGKSPEHWDEQQAPESERSGHS